MPAKDSTKPRSTQARRERGVAGEAVEDGVLGRALVVEHAQHLVVGVPVVDDQRDAVLAWRCRMCARNEASCAAQPSSPVRKRSRPVSPTARTRGSAASRSISARRVVRRRAGAGLVGVQRHGGEHARVPGGQRGRPPRRRHVDADLHQPRDAHGGRGGDLGVDRRLVGQPSSPARRPPAAPPRRCRGACGCPAPAPAAAPGTAAARPAGWRGRTPTGSCGGLARLPPPDSSSSRASSSSTIDSSSFVNTGVGGASGVPAAAAAVDAQIACPAS